MIKIIKLVSGEELIGVVEYEFQTLDTFSIKKPRVIVISFEPKTNQPYIQLMPFIKSDANSTFICNKHAVTGYNSENLPKELENFYLEDTTGLSIATK